jgi:hypothetical protein
MKPLVYDKQGKVPNYVFDDEELWHQPTQLWMLRTSNLRNDHKKLVERVANEN